MPCSQVAMSHGGGPPAGKFDLGIFPEMLCLWEAKEGLYTKSIGGPFLGMSALGADPCIVFSWLFGR